MAQVKSGKSPKKSPKKPVTLKNGVKGANGGARPGAGRKPKAATLLKRKLQADKIAEADYAFSILCEWMHDEELPRDFRRDCANDVLDRVLGKPKQAVNLTETKKILVIGNWKRQDAPPAEPPEADKAHGPA